jgi:hypothetical protein
MATRISSVVKTVTRDKDDLTAVSGAKGMDGVAQGLEKAKEVLDALQALNQALLK